MQITKQADIVVVGAGAGGLCAAITARQSNPDAKVLILEKLSKLGGNLPPIDPITNENGIGLFASQDDDPKLTYADPRMSTDPLTRTDANFNAAMKWSHYRTDARIVRAMIDTAEETSDWTKALITDDFKRYLCTQPKMGFGPNGPIPVPRTEEDKKTVMDGSFQDVDGYFPDLMFYTVNNDDGIEVMFDTPVKKLIKDANGAVTGVLAESKDGGTLNIEAKSVVVSTGGFYGCPELLERYLPCYDETFYEDVDMLGIAHTGDGIKMAFDAGAISDGTTCFEWVIAGGGLHNNDMFPEMIWLSKTGDRFGNEEKINLRNSVYRLPRRAWYLLHDADCFEYCINKPPEECPEIIRDLYGIDMVKRQRARLRDDARQRAEKGELAVCNTLEEAAAFIGCDPEALKKTVGNYNSYCDKGHDDEFVKNPKYLKPIKTAPFYVWKEKLKTVVTHGPIKVNRDMQLLTKDDVPIPGCYYAGLDIGGIDSDSYASSVACHSTLWSLASGRIAGKNAALYAK